MKHAPVAYVLERVAPAAPRPELNPVSAAVAARHDRRASRSTILATRADNGLPAPVPELETREDFAERFRSAAGRAPTADEIAFSGPRCWA
jgi:hypothetical protein